ncbi:MAG: hypothetical protein ACREMK_00690 [Gemmatimonadota bacterium]
MKGSPGRLLRDAALLCALPAALSCGPGPDPGSESGDTALPGDTARQGPPRGPAEGDPEAAVAVVEEYYAAIAAGDFTRAYALWADDGRASGQTFDEFRGGYAETDSVAARVGSPGRIEGAAGSRYVTVPVVVRARMTRGGLQCFEGSYTLRRSVVTGATPDQRHWRVYSGDMAEAEADACANLGGSGDEDAERAVVALVGRFGERLADVPLTAPADRLRQAIREQYGSLVTPELLESWLARPSAAPGRAVSSPWPERIDVQGVRRLDDDRYGIAGEVVLMTSVEMAGGGVTGREPILLEAVRGQEGDWRISDYREREAATPR